MKLFDSFEAIKFRQENLIFITHDGYIYYIYNPRNKHWNKHCYVGYDHITVANYDDVNKEELTEAMNGVYPKRETDFMRLCHPSELWICDMFDILQEDYAKYLTDSDIRHTILRFLSSSDICHKSYEAIRKLLDSATTNNYGNEQVVVQIKELSLNIIGRDIFKKEIGIVDGHNSSSYFCIMPVRVVDYNDSGDIDSVAQMKNVEISIEEDDVDLYLTPFLYKYFNEEIDANKHRRNVSGFEWFLEHNFFTYDQMEHVLKDIADTVDALISRKETEHTKKPKYNVNTLTKDDTEIELVIDFYQRFLYRMEYMMKVGKEKGYDLISFMGP